MKEDDAIRELEHALWKLRELKQYDAGEEELLAARGRVLLWMARLTGVIATEGTA